MPKWPPPCSQPLQLLNRMLFTILHEKGPWNEVDDSEWIVLSVHSGQVRVTTICFDFQRARFISGCPSTRMFRPDYEADMNFSLMPVSDLAWNVLRGDAVLLEKKCDQ